MQEEILTEGFKLGVASGWLGNKTCYRFRGQGTHHGLRRQASFSLVSTLFGENCPHAVLIRRFTHTFSLMTARAFLPDDPRWKCYLPSAGVCWRGIGPVKTHEAWKWS